MNNDAAIRAKIRRQTWRGEIKRAGEDHFIPVSLLGATLPLHCLAHSPEEMGRNILNLELLRRLVFPDFEKPMQKMVVRIIRK